MTKTSWERKKLLKGNKKHFSSFLKGCTIFLEGEGPTLKVYSFSGYKNMCTSKYVDIGNKKKPSDENVQVMGECPKKWMSNLWKLEQSLTNFEPEKQPAAETIERVGYIKLKEQEVREGIQNCNIRKSRKSKNTYLLQSWRYNTNVIYYISML